MGGIQHVPEWYRSEFERNSSHEGTCHEGTTITLGDTRIFDFSRWVMPEATTTSARPIAQQTIHAIACCRNPIFSWRHTNNVLQTTMSNVLQRSLGQTSAQKSWAIVGKEVEYNELRHTPTQPVSATIAEIQLLVDVTRTTYYIRRCQRASITKQVMRTSHNSRNPITRWCHTHDVPHMTCNIWRRSRKGRTVDAI